MKVGLLVYSKVTPPFWITSLSICITMGPDPTDVTLGVVQVITVALRRLMKEDRGHIDARAVQ